MMKTNVKKSSTLFLLFLLTLATSIYPNENDWVLEIELSAKSYMLHQPIWIDVTLTNNSSDTLRTYGLGQPNQGQFRFDIIDSNGELIKYTGIMNASGGGFGGWLLEAGEQDYGSFNLSELFGQFFGNSGYRVPTTAFPYLLNGSYTVQARFEESSSNELSFSVVEPSGEELDALRLIEKAESLWKHEDTDPSSQLFQAVVDRFPNSLYAEICLFLSITYSQKVWNQRIQGTYGNFEDRIVKRELIKKFPNSGNSKSWLHTITRDLDNEEKLAIFNQYVKDHPNTRSARFAKLKHQRILKARNAKREE